MRTGSVAAGAARAGDAGSAVACDVHAKTKKSDEALGMGGWVVVMEEIRI